MSKTALIILAVTAIASTLLGATGATSAATITVSWTQTVGGSTLTLVGPIVSFSIMPGSSTVDFVQPIDMLSPTISQDVSVRTLVHELDITETSSSSSDITTLAFQSVVFTSFSPPLIYRHFSGGRPSRGMCVANTTVVINDAGHCESIEEALNWLVPPRR